jgi:hypothetical protein
VQDIQRAVGGVDATEVSTTKWQGLRDVVAEALLVSPEDVYVTTVSKPGNLGVHARPIGDVYDEALSPRTTTPTSCAAT